MIKNKYLTLLSTLLLPALIIFNNNPNLIDFFTFLNFCVFPFILSLVIILINLILSRKNNFFLDLVIFSLIINLLLNFLIFDNSLVGIKNYLVVNFLILIIFILIRLFFKFKLKFHYINFFCLLFFLITIFIHLKTNLSTKKIENFDNIFVSNLFDQSELKIKPDIYHIIPDGMLNLNTLEQFGFTHSKEFKEKLEQIGFNYIENSLTNYPTTFFSLSSTLNGSLVNENLEFSEKQINKTMYNSRLHELLIKNDYKIFWYSTNWLGSKCNKNLFKCMNTSFYEGEFLKNYLLLININHSWIDKISFKFLKKRKKMHLDKITRDLDTILKEKKPRYVYGYLNTPHSPYTVDPKCIYVHEKGLKENITFTKKQYFEQVLCLKNQIEKFTLKIEEKNRRPFIIIIQSDTGWSFDPNLIDEGRPQPQFPDRLWPSAWFDNFLAISKNFECIDETKKISNSDLFPIIVNCLNNKKLDLNNINKFDVYHSNHPKHGKIYRRKDLE